MQKTKKQSFIQTLITNSENMQKFLDKINGIIFNACTEAWEKRFPRHFITVTSLNKTVYWRYVGLASLIIYIDYENNKYYFPQNTVPRKVKYKVINLFGGAPPNFDLQPVVSAENGKNFHVYVEPVAGDTGYFYFYDDQAGPGDILNIDLDLSYQSSMCLNESNTSKTEGTFYIPIFEIIEPLPDLDLMITREPKMPDNIFKINFDPLPETIGMPKDSLIFKWYLELNFTEHGRNDHHRIPEDRDFLDNKREMKWKPDWNSLMAGGITHVYILAVVNEYEMKIDPKGYKEYKIKGINPDGSSVRAALGGYPAINIACWESLHRLAQFDSNNWPLFGPPNGWGIMQIDNPPAQCPLTEEVIWNWRKNVEMGLCVVSEKENDAEGYPARIRARGFPNATDFTRDQLLYETIQRYNGGSYWTWGEMLEPSQGQQWFAAPQNNYVENVLNANCE